MDNRKGKRESNSDSDDDEVRQIDLTLKLGPSLHCKQKEAGDGAKNGGVQGFSSMENSNVEYSSSPPTYWTTETGSTNYLTYHQGGFPLNVATPNRKRGIVEDIKVCKVCGSNTTPLWRKGPDGPQTLCNACGLRHLRTIKRGGE